MEAGEQQHQQHQQHQQPQPPQQQQQQVEGAEGDAWQEEEEEEDDAAADSRALQRLQRLREYLAPADDPEQREGKWELVASRLEEFQVCVRWRVGLGWMGGWVADGGAMGGGGG